MRSTGAMALLHWNGLGDHLLAWPALRAIARSTPDAHLFEGPGGQHAFYNDVPLRARAPLHLSDPVAREVDVPASLEGVAHCDTFVSLASWVNPSVLALAAGMGARRTVGFHFPFDQSVKLDPERHMLDNYFAIAKHLVPDARLEAHLQPPVLSQAAVAAARRLRAQLAGPQEKLLFVHPETAPEKMWTPEGYAEALTHFLSHRPGYKVVIVSRSKYPLPLEDSRVLYSQAHLELALALVEQSELFLGIDSVFLHAADLYRKPGVALFGPATSARAWGFRVSEGGCALEVSSWDQLAPLAVAEALLEASEGS